MKDEESFDEPTLFIKAFLSLPSPSDPLVTKLQLGNANLEAPASSKSLGKLELP
jgi:hypothetical protein